jgi:hypothetical protein
VMREDGSGKNWIVTVTNRTVSEKVFVHAFWHYKIKTIEY